MNVDINGFNLINDGTTSCSLPEFPVSLSLANSDDSLVAPSPLPDASGATSDTDFLNYGSPGALPAFGNPVPTDPGALTLLPGGVATDLLITTNPADTTQNPTCISAPVGGSISVGLSATDTVSVDMPTDVTISPWQEDPTGSAFSSCNAVTVSPFLTWQQAVAIVGPPSPESPKYGLLPMVNEALYEYAP
jgi:hypothetical protein